MGPNSSPTEPSCGATKPNSGGTERSYEVTMPNDAPMSPGSATHPANGAPSLPTNSILDLRHRCEEPTPSSGSQPANPDPSRCCEEPTPSPGSRPANPDPSRRFGNPKSSFGPRNTTPPGFPTASRSRSSSSWTAKPVSRLDSVRRALRPRRGLPYGGPRRAASFPDRHVLRPAFRRSGLRSGHRCSRCCGRRSSRGGGHSCSRSGGKTRC